MQTVPSKTNRVIGYDVARSLAMLGMMVVHFSMVASTDRTKPPWLASILAALDGRATAIFIILAGVGLTLMTRRIIATGDPAALAEIRHTMIRRGMFLLAIGFLNLTIWAGDILRVYGVSLMVASILITSTNRRLLVIAIAFVITFVLLVVLGDFERNWDWKTLTYHNLWTPEGALRNLFYDGFRSVLPWTGVMAFGMWLGRLELAKPQTSWTALLIGSAVAMSAELLSRFLVRNWSMFSSSGLDAETAQFLFGTESMPALPLFLLSAVGTATAVISFCVLLTETWPGVFWQPLTAMGQLALTWYVAHILIGLGTLLILERVGTESLPSAAGYGFLFFTAAMLLSRMWKSIFHHGPLESVMRRVAG